MEIISIEDRTFDKMLKRLETAARMAEDVHRRFREKKMGEWLDNQEACILLNITPRTLQSLRENGMLAYSQICHKIYYIPEDIQKTLSLLFKFRKYSNNVIKKAKEFDNSMIITILMSPNKRYSAL